MRSSQTQRWRCSTVFGLLGMMIGASGAWGQITEARAPVFIANAPLAEEALQTVGALMSRGSEDESVRLIQRVLDEQGDGLIASDRDGIFIPVRKRVIQTLLSDELLLSAYRSRQTPRARALLAEGRWREVEASYWLTEPGAEAALRLAQTLIESARFSSGLEQLRALRSHPDVGAIAGDAAVLASFAAGLVDTDDAWELANVLAASGGMTPPMRERSERPQLSEVGVGSSLAWRSLRDAGNAERMSLDGLVPDSLHEAMLTELPAAPSRIEQPARRVNSARPKLPWVIPTLADGYVLTADGYTISCFDRFTLRPRWRLRGSAEDSEPRTRELRSRIGRTVEDSASVTVDGPDAFTSLGLAKSESERSPARVMRIDMASGKVVWSVVLSDLDESLRGAEPRGPIVVDADTVIIGARKNQRNRRLVGLTLVGLDRETGSVRWMQSVGSAGSLPFQQPTHTAEGGVLGDGVVYWSDKIGLVAAVETGTGRAVWVRESSAPELYTRGTTVPFATSLPVLTEFGLFVLSPDQSTIRLIDPSDGSLIHDRVAEPFSDAGYLVRVGRFIASVGSTRVAFYDMQSFGNTGEAGMVFLSDVIEETGIRGRAIPVGDRLAVPVQAGLAMIDPGVLNSDGVTPAMVLALDETGNPAIADGQIVIAGESDVYSFLSWSTASEMLTKRIEDGDGQAALSLAELAVRSGNHPRVIDAIDDAIRIAGRDRDASTLVFDTAMKLLDPGRSVRGGSLGLELRGRLLDRVGSVARTSGQRVAHAMGVGDWLAASGDIPGAARAYQDVLLEPALSKSIWSGGGLSVRAELEASRRLQDLAERFGTSATRFAEELAALRISDAGTGAEPSAWVQIAQQFPVTRASVRAWNRAGMGWLRAERWSSAERAARSGLRSIELAQRRGEGGAIDPVLGDQLAGTMVVAMQMQSRGEDARGLIESFNGRLGMDLTPVVAGRSVSLGASETRRRVLLGNTIRREAVPGLIAGSPIASSVGGDASLVLMHAPHLGRVSLFRTRAETDTPQALSEVWSIHDAGSVVPVVAHSDARSIVLVWPSELAIGRDARAQAIGLESGEVVWETLLSPTIAAVRPVYADAGARDGGVIASPLDGSVPSDQLLEACDGRTLFITDRRGRAMGIDVASGRTMWSGALAMTRVFSVDIGGGVVGLSGARPRDPELAFDGRGQAAVINEERFSGLRGIVEAIDPRSGETIQMLDTLDPNARWVRVANDGQVIVGSGNGIVALDTNEGRVDWSNGDDVLTDSQAAWIVGEWLVILDTSRTMWLVPRREGVRRRSPLETLGRGADRGWVSVERIGGGFVVFGAEGFGAYDADASLIAANAEANARAFMVSALAERHAVFVERPALGQDDRTVGRVLLVDRASGRFTDIAEVEVPVGISRSPLRIALADGVVVIGYGEVSIVLRVPLESTR